MPTKPGQLQIMIDATRLKAHRTAISLLKMAYSPTYRAHERRPERQTSRLCDTRGRPLVMLLSEGQMSDFKGTALVLPAMPGAKELLADKSYDADWFRQALATRKIAPLHPLQIQPLSPIPHDAILYRQRHKSRTCSAGSRTRDAFTPDTTVAPISTSPQSASP
jgi:transposase